MKMDMQLTENLCSECYLSTYVDKMAQNHCFLNSLRMRERWVTQVYRGFQSSRARIEGQDLQDGC